MGRSTSIRPLFGPRDHLVVPSRVISYAGYVARCKEENAVPVPFEDWKEEWEEGGEHEEVAAADKPS